MMDYSRANSVTSELYVDWSSWSELPWVSRSAGLPELQLCIRLLESAAQVEEVDGYLKQELPEAGSEFAASWIAVYSRGGEWEKLGEFGRQPMEHLPVPFLADVLDRNAGGWMHSADTKSASVLAAPLDKSRGENEVLIASGRAFEKKMLPGFLAVSHTLGLGLAIVRRQARAIGRVARLRATLQISSQLCCTHEMAPLLELIAREAARLIDADRASIFIWDREHHEVVACPALGVTGPPLHLADTLGIVGECLQTGNAIRVDDAYHDPRFNPQVDAKSGYHTRSLLCVPLIDGQGRRIGAFEAINKRHGAFTNDDEEGLTELGTQAATALQNTRERENLVRGICHLREQVARHEGEIIGQSPAIAALRTTIERLAPTDLPVLILGESGTGKEVVAHALHAQGPRRENPFVAVNCAALTETLLESELFGHEKGAFTDAHEARQGKFEIAAGGTLFLDEIGDMSPGGQAKLLRVLEQKVLTRVGGSQPIRTNVRVIAATNTNLAAAVRDRKFREDLYYRLSVVALELPPLRDRPDDILPLAEAFLKQFSSEAGRRPLALSPEARRRLQLHAWPGNVRELRNLMERIAFLCPTEVVEVGDLAFILSPERDAAPPMDLGLSDATARFQQDYIRRMIKRAQGNMSQAAGLLGLHRSNLYRKMRHLNMHEAEDEPDDATSPVS